MKFRQLELCALADRATFYCITQKSISSQTSCLCTCTVHGHKYSSPSILRYIFHIKPHFSKQYCEVISKRILIIFSPEEAELFKDYLFILA